MAEPTPFERLAEEVVAWRARRDPAWASRAGVPGHDPALKDVSREAYKAEAREARDLLVKLSHTPGRTIDRDALGYVLELVRFRLERERAHARDPDLAGELLDHLLPLVDSGAEASRARVEALASRLAAGPAFLVAGRSRVEPEHVPPLWVEAAIAQTESVPAVMTRVRLLAEEPAVPVETRARIEGALKNVEAALAEHRRWLLAEVAPHARGDAVLGEERFEDLLSHRFLAFHSEALIELGERLREEAPAQGVAPRAEVAPWPLHGRGSLGLLLSAPETVWGWAWYARGEPPLLEGIDAARRAIVHALGLSLDAGLHTRRVTFEDAVSRLVDEARVPPGEARVIVTSWTKRPGEGLSAMLGLVQMEALREKCLAGGLSEREFHDRVLAAGALPLALLERAVKPEERRDQAGRRFGPEKR